MAAIFTNPWDSEPLGILGNHLLTNLDEDMLTAVLLGLPAPRRREWIFVALTCKALHAAVLRASVVDTAEEQRALGLPVGRHNAPVDVVFPTGYRFATSIAGMLTTPLRIVYSKECLRPYEALRCTGTLLEANVPTRVREQFLRVLSHHSSQAPPPQCLEEHVKVRARRARAESLAAYRLTTRALYHMVHLAPLHTLRAAFFEVLGGNQHCALDLTLRHHRCLVFFAAVHGRLDVLDRLVHRDPSRALAYDFDKGLLPVLQSCGEEMSCTFSTSTTAHAYGGQAERVSESQLLLARPAALHNQVNVLAWMDLTRMRLQQRRFKMGSTLLKRLDRPLKRQARMKSSLTIGGLTLSICASGVGAHGLRVYGAPDVFRTEGIARSDHDLLRWRALRLLVSEASNGAAIDVLNRLWKQVVCSIGVQESYTDWGTSPDTHQDVCFRAAIAWAILLTALTKPRRGAVIEWLVLQCYEHRELLKHLGMVAARVGWVAAEDGLQEDSQQTRIPHTWNPRIFDMEDLMHAALHTSSNLVEYVMTVLDLSTEERILRERIIGPGDAAKTEWLLKELTHTEACLLACARRSGLEDADHPGMMATQHASLTAGEDTYNHETGHGWASRSLAGYSGEGGEGGGGGFFLRAELDPGRWSRTDSLCLHLSRQSFHVVGALSTVAPLLFETPESVAGNFVQRSVPAALADLPESYVFTSQVGSCNTWVPEEGLFGFTRLQQGVATVLKRWLLHALDTEPVRCGGTKETMRFTYWERIVREAPEACYAAIGDVCTQLFCTSKTSGVNEHGVPPDDDAHRGKAWMRERRAILAALVCPMIETFCNPESRDFFQSTVSSPQPRLRWRCAWAVAYTELGALHGLLVPGGECADGLLESARRSRISPLHEAMLRALARDSHATGNCRLSFPKLHKTQQDAALPAC